MTLNAPSQFAKKIFGVVTTFGLLFGVNLTAAQSSAEESRAWSCSEKLLKFVDMIDELFVKNVREREPFYAAIREYLPPKGCTTEQVISISRTSKFSVPPFEQYA